MKQIEVRSQLLCRALLIFSILGSTFPPGAAAALGERTTERGSARGGLLRSPSTQDADLDGDARPQVSEENDTVSGEGDRMTLSADRVSGLVVDPRMMVAMTNSPATVPAAGNPVTSFQVLNGLGKALQTPGQATSGFAAMGAIGHAFENSTIYAAGADANRGRSGSRSGGGKGNSNNGGGNRGPKKPGYPSLIPEIGLPGGFVQFFPGDQLGSAFEASGPHSSQMGKAGKGYVVIFPSAFYGGKMPIVATVAKVLKFTAPQDGDWKKGAQYTMLLQAEALVRVKGFEDDRSGLRMVRVEPLEIPLGDPQKTESYIEIIRQNAGELAANNQLPPQLEAMMGNLAGILEQGQLDAKSASEMAVRFSPVKSPKEQQSLLNAPSIEKRLEMVAKKLSAMKTDFDAKAKMHEMMERQMLLQQREALDKQLGDDDEDEAAKFEAQAAKLNLSKEAREKVEKDIKRLKRMSPGSPEATVVYNWLERILSLPWGKNKALKTDMKETRTILDEDHYGLEKIKKRISQRVAVLKRTGKLDGAIVCLVGPPGVGKTSLGQSIARATGRDFIRISLGGVRDEAEIRGHRRTYIGAEMGKILSAVQKAKSDNLVMMLDEGDKMGEGTMTGNPNSGPSAALLEVMDPKQNHAFTDHYLGTPYDLSKVMFIVTANTLDTIPAALRDRMEIIQLEGYDEDEKVEIAKRHIIPQQLEARDLKDVEIPEETIRAMIQKYTQENGVRMLEKTIGRLLDAVVEEMESDKPAVKAIPPGDLEKYLEKSHIHDSELPTGVGIINGLWVNGEGGNGVLQIQVNKDPLPEGAPMDNKIKFKMTGQLGDVMKESIEAAFSAVMHFRDAWQIPLEDFYRHSFHVHVPAGATPKDGPSAGVAIATAIVSVMKDWPGLADVAMTGEIDIQGLALPIGGLKGKTLAAKRKKMKKVLYPVGNEADRQELSAKTSEGMEMTPMRRLVEATMHALQWPADKLAAAKAALLQDEKPGETTGASR